MIITFKIGDIMKPWKVKLRQKEALSHERERKKRNEDLQPHG